MSLYSARAHAGERIRFLVVGFAWFVTSVSGAAASDTLEGTQHLEADGDLAAQMVAGIDRFLLREIEESDAKREKFWHRDLSSPEAYAKSIAPQRARLAHILGVRDERVEDAAPELIRKLGPAPAATIGLSEIMPERIRWAAFGDVHGEGLLIAPRDGEPVADIILIPDADQSPEQLVGPWTKTTDPEYVKFFRSAGCRVLIPALVSRELRTHRHATMTNREFVYRAAFEMGRHIVGYEVQKVLAAVDWMERDSQGTRKIAVVGYGEGGLIALCAAALDERIDAVVVAGYFDDRNNVWSQPVSRNIFGLLEQFGDAELATMVLPRPLIIDTVQGPELELKTQGGAPGKLVSPDPKRVKAEIERAKRLVEGLDPASLQLFEENASDRTYYESSAKLLTTLGIDVPPAPLGGGISTGTPPDELAVAAARQQRQIHELDRHNQWLLRESPYIRREFMAKLDTNSREKYAASAEPYRKFFREQVIGEFDRPLLPPRPRSRKVYDEEKWTGYEVMLDVFPDVFAYGILLLPKNLPEGEQRPVVVCQHGLEGRPTDCIVGDHRAYHDFAAKLCERGFVVFAPQNPYIGHDAFRTLQRKANPLGKTLFSIIVPQHQQIVDWLQTLPNVDPNRIGFYGLSYGGKTAMRVPALVTDYALSICSADFGDWIWKNASTRSTYSYIGTGEYEIYEFDLGNTFNYSEMAALIAPRPFMVERGHFDGVQPDETVAYEFAKVRNLYQARLGIGERTEIEFFAGPHTINGQGTFDFLHRHLCWPAP
ncbi:MAG: dienelactone hydrolase family protein [Planctomycetales bacterium]|nr:dienelactone hydrolase family protein [Planctomycetales bacterium]